eukprot:gene17837-24221_t
MKPILLKGHERPLTQLKYNREGDFIVTCAKVSRQCASGRSRLARSSSASSKANPAGPWPSASACDQTVRIWQLQTGKELFRFQQGEPCRAVALSVGEGILAYTCDAFMGTPPQVHLVKLDLEDLSQQSAKPILSIPAPRGRITHCFWSDLNRALITSHEDGFLRKWDSETGKIASYKSRPSDTIQTTRVVSKTCRSQLIGLPLGITSRFLVQDWAKLVDWGLKVSKTERPGTALSAAMSPIFDHVITGGGQDASQVTTTSAKAGGFESRFFHKIYAEEFGQIRGHFGPINTIAVHPDGRSFTTGGEDGFVRIHPFDMDYFTTKFF